MCLTMWKIAVCCCVIPCSLVAVCLLSPKLSFNQTMQCDIPEDICLSEHQISHSNGTVQSVQFHPSSLSFYFHVGYKWVVYRNYQTVMAQNFVWQTRLEMENINCYFFSGTIAWVRPWPPPPYFTGWHSASIVYGFKHELFLMWMAGVISPMPQPPTWWTLCLATGSNPVWNG